jgi:hypothetical protein
MPEESAVPMMKMRFDTYERFSHSTKISEERELEELKMMKSRGV